MKAWYRALCIQDKVTFVITLTVLSALSISAVVITVVDAREYQKYFVRNLMSQARIVGYGSIGAITFGDPEAAKEVLDAFQTNRTVRCAVLETNDFGELYRYQQGNGCAKSTGRVLLGFLEDTIQVKHPVVEKGQRVATVSVHASTEPIVRRVLGWLKLAVSVGAAVCLFAILLSRRVSRLVTAPIVDLTRLAKDVARGQDYSIRAKVHHDDEVGSLAESLNTMLQVTESSNEELAKMNEHLGELVKKRTAKLETACEEALAASRAKSQFLANMSHEIRTPMNAVIGMTELLLLDEIPDDQLEKVRSIRRAADGLLSILNDVLDFSKIEAGKFELSHEDFNVIEVVENCAEVLAANAHDKGVELLCDISSDIPSWMHGDGTRLRQVLLNLAGNAIKFTDKGEVAVSVRIEQELDGSILLRFEVRDTGIGIPEEQQAKVFESFAQADGSNTRKYGGTGLGLAICSRIVEKFGGEIGVRSTVGVGSTFWFTGRFEVLEKAPEELEPTTELREVLQGRRLLMVDDNLTNLRILGDMLASFGIESDGIDIPATALRMLEEAVADGRPYDLLLTDAQMPEMSGFDLVEAVKRNPAMAQIRVMMLSSVDVTDVERRCRTLHIPVYVMKPVSRRALKKGLRRLCAVLEDKPRKALSGASAAGEGCDILLAEDNELNVKVAVALLEKHGHRVTVARDGVEAVDAYKQGGFDVVLMDVQMPNLGGMEATAQIREFEAGTGNHTPIVALTAHAFNDEKARFLEGGMDDYMRKPFNATDLWEMVNRHTCDRKESPPMKASAAPASSSGGSERFESAIRDLGDDAELFETVMQRFLAGADEVLDRLKDAVARGDRTILGREGHKLKGSVAASCWTDIRDAAEKLEDVASQNGELVAVPIVEQLESGNSVFAGSVRYLSAAIPDRVERSGECCKSPGVSFGKPPIP